MINREQRRPVLNTNFNFSAGGRFTLWSVAAILLLTLIVYSNSINNDFTNWDDNELVVENTEIRSLDFDRIIAMFTPKPGHTYQPVRVLSYTVDYYFWQLNPAGYHGVNILLHALSAFLLYFLLMEVLRKIRPEWKDNENRIISLFTALLFVVHPLNVEAVTWISSRKYGLLAFFSFLSLFFYLASRREQKVNIIYYLASLGVYLLALLSSPFSLTFPCLLFLYDFCRASKNSIFSILKKHGSYYVPYCLLAVLYFFIQWSALRAGVDNTIKPHYLNQPLYTFLTMLSILLSYLKNILFPFWLNNRYIVKPSLTLFDIKVITSIFIILGSSIYVFRQTMKGNKFPLFCLGWFFVWWLPAANIIPLSTKLADRYLYLSAVGLFLLFSTFIVQFAGGNYKKIRALAVFTLFTVVIFSCSYLTIQRNKVWANSLTLWQDSLRKEPDSRIAHLNLGEILDEQGRLEEAIAHYGEALRLDPRFAEAHNNLGVTLAKQGKVEEAITHYLEALRLYENSDKVRMNFAASIDPPTKQQKQIISDVNDLILPPGYARALSNLGVALALQGKFAQATAYCQRALELRPQWSEGHNNLGNALAAQGKFHEAVHHLSRAVELKPSYADGHNNLAVIYVRLGRFAEASAHYRKAIQLKPDSAEIHNNLGVALAAQGKLDEAVEHYKRAVELKPKYAEAHMNLGNGLCDQGDFHRGTAHLSRALAIDKNSAEIHNNLGVALARQGKLEEAIVHFTVALRLQPDYEQAQLNLQLAIDEKKDERG
jgi:Flp pilus assembly protein TadD